MLRFRRKSSDFLEVAAKRITLIDRYDRTEGLRFLNKFFSEIRPGSSKGKQNPETNLLWAIQLLRDFPLLLTNLQNALFSQLVATDLTRAITESGIPLARGFWQEFSDRLKHKVLPPLQDENDFLYVINHVFFRKNDIEWVEEISTETWATFFQLTGLPFRLENKTVQQQLVRSLVILSYQVAQLGLEKEISNYIPGNFGENPFIQQNYLLHKAELLMDSNQDITEQLSTFKTLTEKIHSCEEYLLQVRNNLAERGASLRQTYIVLILSSRLQRIHVLLDALDADEFFDAHKLVDFFRVLIRNENRKNSIREFLSQGLGYLAYRIAEHKGEKGDKYITTTSKEFMGMILSAMGGGLVISFIAVFKNLLGKLALAPFWQGFVYSVNYSIGFILIEQTNSTLATKQPAFTASAVAASLDKQRGPQPDLYNLALTVAKVSRSQIASFFGNLVVVFPFTFFLAWLYTLITGNSIIDDTGSWKMLHDQHPFRSPALLYACFTGFFLFASGIIAGYMQNKIQYARIGARLQMHPLLRISFTDVQLASLANFVEKNAGAIIGNISLGFFLGMSGLIGKIFGIPFDIRHITIAAGNCAIAVQKLGFTVIPPIYLLTAFIGVLGIGFLNFLVSFSLAFLVAVKSRGIHLYQYPRFLRILWKYFRNNPLDFIRPRKIL